MTHEELAERDRLALERQKERKAALPADRAPMPDYAAQEMLALSQVSRATGSNSLSASLNGRLSSIVMSGIGKK
jgi:hypothetical protein